MKNFFLTAVLCVMVVLQVFALAQDEPKKRIEGVDDLPRRTYKVEGTVTELYNDEDAFRSFAKIVRADIENDLAVYEIEDRATLRGYYDILLSLDVMDGAYENAMEKIRRIRELHDKQASRLTSGIVTESVLRAYIEAGPDRMFDRELFVRILSKAVDTLPWGIVQERIEQLKGRMDVLSENFILSIIQGQFDPVVERSGHISNDIAERLISLRFIHDFQLPLKQEIILVFEEYIAANRFEKEDIWEERNIMLSEKDDLHPVIIGIWDTGIDTEVFPEQLYVNRGEEVNGRDDDLNGFIDDVNGIAYDVQEEKTPEILYPLGDAEGRLPELKKSIKGFMDIQTAIESPEAAVLKRRLAGMQPEELKLLLEDMMRMALYAHGTHVAGIAVEGNPFARIMVVRFTVDYHTIPMAPTIELSTRMARAYSEAIEYMKTRGVRVVNMSWGGAVRDTERDLEANGIGKTAEERARMAREMFDIEKRALYEAMKNAPEILFVNAAGNDNDDVAFEDYYPAAFDLPNLLVVGAVDKAGDVTSFTSFGKTVDVYANGYEVESYLPGGDRLAASGTSASSPNAANLAAKLFALDPSLKPSEVIELIHTAADPNDEGLLLINPKRSVQLLGSR